MYLFSTTFAIAASTCVIQPSSLNLHLLLAYVYRPKKTASRVLVLTTFSNLIKGVFLLPLEISRPFRFIFRQRQKTGRREVLIMERAYTYAPSNIKECRQRLIKQTGRAHPSIVMSRLFVIRRFCE